MSASTSTINGNDNTIKNAGFESSIEENFGAVVVIVVPTSTFLNTNQVCWSREQ